jgi:microcystin-dependent protein
MKQHVATAMLAGALSIVGINLASAQEMYLGEVRLFAYNWCPVGWMQAAGQILPISQYTALFSLLGTSFGGNGTTNFGLPNLSGSAPYGQLANNQGQPFGAVYGQSTVTLTVANLPPHTHQLFGSSANPGTYSPAGALLGTDANTAAKSFAPSGSPANTPMAVGAVGLTGSAVPVSIQSPALSMNWCIAYQGIYPSRP